MLFIAILVLNFGLHALSDKREEALNALSVLLCSDNHDQDLLLV